jgi:septum formation protein
MILEKLNNFNIILASKSPRRQELLKQLDVNFDVADIVEVDESFDESIKAENIPIYLSQKKAKAYLNNLKNNDILITADTIVWLNNKALNKPKDRAGAIEMLKLLSNKTHNVYTGVTISSKEKSRSFVSSTKVKFKQLTSSEIVYYVDKYKPFDKAGAYGIQEWIGYIGITKIEGSYFNVMGLPVQQLYSELKMFVGKNN